MKRSKNNATMTAQAGVATATAATAVSLTLMPVAQETATAQDLQSVIRIIQQDFSDDQCFNKYFENGYNYCDAVVLAAYWNHDSAGDAKLLLGAKMLRWGPEDGELHVRAARGEALKKPDADLPAWYTDGGYTYDDAEMLARYWGEDLTDAKYTMTRLLIGGHERVVQAALGSAGR